MRTAAKANQPAHLTLSQAYVGLPEALCYSDGGDMRILLVGNHVLDRRKHAVKFYGMLSKHLRGRGHLVEVIHPGAALERTRLGVLRPWLAAIERRALFPLQLRGAAQGFDLVHICHQEDAIYVGHTAGVPATLTCNDVLDIAAAEGKIPEYRGSNAFRARQRKTLRYLERATHVVCSSWKTSRELGSLLELDRQRRLVIPAAVEVDSSAVSAECIQKVREDLGLAEGEHYLLHVGGNQWYRNRPGLLRIFRMVRQRTGSGLRLVVAGVPLTDDMRQFVAANLPKGSVIEVANPDDSSLWAIYAGAVALLLPSFYERSGWRIAEAQSCGCPVITSNRAPMTETAGPAALYIDPRDEAAAAEAIASKLEGLGSLRNPGLENAKRFHPEAVFSAYESFFLGVLRTRRVTDVVIAANEAESVSTQSREG